MLHKAILLKYGCGAANMNFETSAMTDVVRDCVLLAFSRGSSIWGNRACHAVCVLFGIVNVWEVTHVFRLL